MRYAAMLALLAAGACGGTDYASVEELMDPEACMDCHPKQYREWKSSMHAYAADDPVFLAMNRRGQEEADLGDFCVQCHAPMAVELGLTTDGLNLDEIPQKYKGVTCYFCHSAESVEDDHNNPIVLADDGVLRGSFADPVNNGFHRAGYSPLLDSGNTQESSRLCGSCHDIVTPAGVHLERTYAEWQESVFARTPQGGCNNCHMFFESGTAADFDGVPLRDVREHTFPGVDTALTPWPDMELQREQIERDLYYAINPYMCVNPDAGGVQIDMILDNVGGGHALPSGAAQDRRMWVELVAYDDSDNVIFSTGVVDEGEALGDLDDPNLWVIRDFATDENGEEAHMFWDIREVDSQTLDWAKDPGVPHTVNRIYQGVGDPARITARVRVRAVGLDVLDDLLDSGHLEDSVRDAMPTLTLTGTELEWVADDHGLGCLCRSGPCSI